MPVPESPIYGTEPLREDHGGGPRQSRIPRAAVRAAMRITAAVTCGATLWSCDSHDTLRLPPTGPGLSTGLGCTTSCVILRDPWVFAMAAQATDSAGASIVVGSYEVTGVTGDLARVQLEPGDAATPGPDLDLPLLEVRVGQNRSTFTARQLIAGVDAYRFASPGVVSIEYRLRRGVRIGQMFRARLVQQVSGGVAGVPAASASVATGDPSCQIMGPGPACGGLLNVDISPYVGDPSVGRFQSAGGNGVSKTITVTFSEPISSATIFIGDPDFATNYIEAYNAAGELVDRQAFESDGTPGTYTEDTKTVSGAGITTLRLVPAPLDFVNYGGFFVTPEPPHKLKVTCTPAGVARADSTRCVAKLADSTATGTLVERYARGASPYVTTNTLVAAPQSEALQAGDSVVWQGRGLVSTWVGFRVQTTAEGGGVITLADSARIAVQPRNWAPPGTSQTLVTFDLPEVYDDSLKKLLMDPIRVDSTKPNLQDFPKGGFGQNELIRNLPWRWNTVGPDTGWHFLSFPPTLKPPAVIPDSGSVIWIHPWLKPGSSFYTIQKKGPAGGGRKYCEAKDVDSLAARVRRHELRHHEMAKLFYQVFDANTISEPAATFFTGDPTVPSDKLVSDSLQDVADSLTFGVRYDKWQKDSVDTSPYTVLIPNCVFRIPSP